MNLKPFGKLLRRERLNKNYALRDVAKYLGISFPSVYHYEEGDSYPSLENVEKLCKLFNLNQGEINKMIEEEKGKEKKQRREKRYLGLSSARYPNLREVLLSSYNQKDYGEGYAQKELIRRELKKYPFHPFEKKLLEEIHNRLIGKKIINPGIESIELFTGTSKESLFKKITEIGFEWTYNPNHDFLVVTFRGNKKGSRQSKKIGLKWQEIK